MTYPQPREGITGTLRDDDLLSLEDSALARRKIMLAMALTLWSTALAAYPIEPASLWKRMDKPRVGDLVVENTRTDPVRGLGILIGYRKEWAFTDEEWQQIETDDPGAYAGDRPIDDVWYIQYGPQPEDVCRWSNASFIAIPTERGWLKADVMQ